MSDLHEEYAPAPNKIDALVERLFSSGQEHMVEQELEKLDDAALSDDERRVKMLVLGMCAFQNNQHAVALERFKEAQKKYPDDPEILFSLAQEHIFLENPDEAFALFDQCIFPAIPPDHALVACRYAYLHNDYARGIRYIEPMFDFYKDLQILDDTFIYNQGLPFFSVAWAHMAANCILAGETDKLASLTESIKTRCIDYDFDMLAQELKAYTEDDLQSLITPIEEFLPQIDSMDPFYYVWRLRLASYKAQNVEDYKAAILLVHEKGKTNIGFPWLEDMEFLIKAKLANQFGAKKNEQEFLKRFLDKQPLLFEPDHALNFGVLDYQEKLKNAVEYRVT